MQPLLQTAAGATEMFKHSKILVPIRGFKELGEMLMKMKMKDQDVQVQTQWKTKLAGQWGQYEY